MDQSLANEIEDILTPISFLLKDDAADQMLLLERIRTNGNLLQEKLALQLAEKRRLEDQLAKVEAQRADRSHQLREAKYMMKREKLRTKLAERKRNAMKEALDACLENMPTNCRREMQAKIAALPGQATSSSSSNVEVDVTTDSARSSSYVTSVSSCSSELTEESDMEVAFDKRISSSTESERSSVLLFSSMLEALKRRQHSFHDRCFMMGNKCFVCGKKFVCGRKELECLDCQALVHKRCQDGISLPCVPTKKVNVRKVATVAPLPVAAYCCPSFKPQIPAFVIHSVLMVEQSGLREQRLYVLPDYSHETAMLKLQLENDGFLPNMNRLKTSTVCELLKHFFSMCTRPLVDDRLHAALEDFAVTKQKTDNEDLAAFHDVTLKAPEAERATLCMLILHLKKVCESAECKVSVNSMAKTFAPILLRNFNVQATFNEKKQRYEIVQKLLKLRNNFYEFVLKELF